MFQHITHCLLDGARLQGNLDEAKARNKQHDSLYRGRAEQQLANLAPYIFNFHNGTPFTHWLLKAGWGHSWGIMLKSSWPLSELHKHFRKFLKVQTEGGRSLYFRFYDPRVLRIFLPTCDTAQLREFFGPIDYFIMEDEDSAFALRYWQENGFLKRDRFAVTDLIAALPAVAPIEISEETPAAPEALASPAPPAAIKTPEPIPIPPAPTKETHTEEKPPAPKTKSKWNMFD